MFSSVVDAKKTIESLKETLKRDDGCSDFEVFSLIDGLQQIFDIVVAVNKQDTVLNEDKISDVGIRGLSMIDNLVYKLISSDLASHKFEVEQVAMFLANWVVKHKGKLSNIQSVVDGMAHMANQVEDQVSLLQLSTFMNQVAHACTDVIQHDLDVTDPERPWRVLNMNRGIVATRTHDLEIMYEVFPDLIKAIPMDAPDFFKEGISEMERLNYPEPVKELIQEFYNQTQKPVVH